MIDKAKDIVTPNMVTTLTKIFPSSFPRNAANTPPIKGDKSATRLYSRIMFNFSTYSDRQQILISCCDIKQLGLQDQLLPENKWMQGSDHQAQGLAV